VHACFVDLSKAYDTINHTCLWYKLLKSRVSGKFVRILKNMCEKSNSYVEVDYELSESVQQNIGLKQGCVLSPALCNVYVNDLPDLLNITETDTVIINGKII
jgi:hypothetical protein